METGFIHGLIAYAIWGLVPLYFALFTQSSPSEIVAHRASWSFVLCIILLASFRQLGQLRAALSNRRLCAHLAIAGILITTNWMIYVFGIMTERTLDAALGYFINPLVFTALGVGLLGEHLRRTQLIALSFGALAVAVLAVGLEEIPWIALGLALSFGAYGLVKKMAGQSVAPLPGLAAETLAVLPLAVGYLGWLATSGTNSVHLTSWYMALVATTGVVTAVPLLLFASAARRIPLVVLGMLQYLAPISQFLIGWLIFDEPMPMARWLGFILVWIAVIIFTIDAFHERRSADQHLDRTTARSHSRVRRLSSKGIDDQP